MKVVRISAKNYDGAGLCVHRLHAAALRRGIDEILLVAEGKNVDKTIKIIKEDKHYVPISLFEKKIYNFLIKIGMANKIDCLRYELSLLQKKRWIFFTLPYTFYKSLVNDIEVKDADIINLHWISDFVDIPSFFRKVQKPIVWSLHDENPMRGGLHYECSHQEYAVLEKKMQEVKLKALQGRKDIHIVVQSLQMKRMCEKSLLLGEFPITIIPNGVNVEDFQMVDKCVARDSLGLPSNKKIFMFSSVSLEDSRKGLNLLIRTLERLNEDVLLICVGNYTQQPHASFEIKCMGFVSDLYLYSLLYSAADFFVLPSFQESFAKTPLEAMSCGTPVIAFPCSGTEDCIRDFNGVRCSDFTEDALYEGILIAASYHYEANKIRNYVKENFTFSKMAERYGMLYEKIMDNRKL